MKTIVVSKDGNVRVNGQAAKVTEEIRRHAVARRDPRVAVDPKKLDAALRSRGLKSSLPSKEAGYSPCYLSQAHKSKKISVSMLDLLRKHGISKNEISANHVKTKTPRVSSVAIDYDKLYEVIKKAMMDALNS